MVEQFPVKELVVGSSPTCGANKNTALVSGIFLYPSSDIFACSNLLNFVNKKTPTYLTDSELWVLTIVLS